MAHFVDGSLCGWLSFAGGMAEFVKFYTGWFVISTYWIFSF
jgi:hypothetical protein